MHSAATGDEGEHPHIGATNSMAHMLHSLGCNRLKAALMEYQVRCVLVAEMIVIIIRFICHGIITTRNVQCIKLLAHHVVDLADVQEHTTHLFTQFCIIVLMPLERRCVLSYNFLYAVSSKNE